MTNAIRRRMTTHCSSPLQNPYFAAPGEVMVPWNDAEVRPVTTLVKRFTMKLPVAFVNRPVPPVMVLISVS